MAAPKTITVPQFYYGKPDIYDGKPWSEQDIADLRASVETGSTIEVAEPSLNHALAEHPTQGAQPARAPFLH
jgi:hypothetical protein